MPKDDEDKIPLLTLFGKKIHMTLTQALLFVVLSMVFCLYFIVLNFTAMAGAIGFFTNTSMLVGAISLVVLFFVTHIIKKSNFFKIGQGLSQSFWLWLNMIGCYYAYKYSMWNGFNTFTLLIFSMLLYIYLLLDQGKVENK